MGRRKSLCVDKSALTCDASPLSNNPCNKVGDTMFLFMYLLLYFLDGGWGGEWDAASGHERKFAPSTRVDFLVLNWASYSLTK